MGSLSRRSDDVIVLFDLDGTLTESRQVASDEMLNFLKMLRKDFACVGIVSGSDEEKVTSQLKGNAECYDYLFVENGVVSYKDGTLLHTNSISTQLGETLVKNIINFSLKYFSELDIPIKRGTFVEYRTGMMNLSPIGRNCTLKERLEFNAYDKENGIRRRFVDDLLQRFGDEPVQFSIGGQISVDCFPKGWDKRYCLQFVEKEFKQIHFYGDRTAPGGNDYEIFDDARTTGHTVTGPADTIRQLKSLFQIP